MFAFQQPTKAKLVAFNARSERHGDLLIPALDLRFSVDVPNAVLTEYHPELLGLLYEQSPQGQLDGLPQVSELADLRFPALSSPLKWEEETLGYTLVVSTGNTDGNPIQLPDCKLHKHALSPRAGGTCNVAFTLSSSYDVSVETVGRLGLSVQHDLHIVLNPPASFGV